MDTEQNSNRRFGGIERLYGTPAWHNLQQAHVTVVGVGGVGSWVVEALARSGVGHITLIDLDNVAESNVNRQLPAITPLFGMPKVAIEMGGVSKVLPLDRIAQEIITYGR